LRPEEATLKPVNATNTALYKIPSYATVPGKCVEEKCGRPIRSFALYCAPRAIYLPLKNLLIIYRHDEGDQ
jgi:hypothetical protein